MGLPAVRYHDRVRQAKIFGGADFIDPALLGQLI